MKPELLQKINSIIESGTDTPNIFKNILKRELALTDKEEVLDVLEIKRVYADSVRQQEVISHATLLLATANEFIVIEEGPSDFELEYGGYRIQHILYSKINILSFDSCLLRGVLKIVAGSNSDSILQIDFDTSKDYFEIEKFTAVVRQKMIEKDRI
ncbi:MAG: hypothetical protein EOM70_04245 [Clostridia bacterium]|nr:hypothetical protein [Clostridia bacterium]